MATISESTTVVNPSTALVGTLEIDIISRATDNFGKLFFILAVTSLILFQLLTTSIFARDAEWGVMPIAGELPIA